MTVTDTRTSHSESRPVPVVATGSPAERFTSTNPDDFAVPTGREEQWRFTPLRSLRPLFQPFHSAGTITLGSTIPAGVSLTLAGRDHPLFGVAGVPADRASVLAAAGTEQVTVVKIPANAELDEPITLTFTGAPGLNYGHLIIEAGQFSSAVVVLDHVGATTLVDTVELIVRDGAKLTVVTVQDWDPTTIQLSAHDAQLGRDATLRHVAINLGGKLIRITPTIKFAGPGARAELYGLSYARDGQHQEARLYVDHSVPQCSSDVVYKSVVEGDKSHAVWIGDVRIRPAATGTSTYELNRNLLLTDGARADSVPNLEIETGEIAGAGHASATGRFDELQLFYLQSRGIPEDEARRLVIRGFFDDILGHIPVPALRERLSTVIDARLDGL